MSRNPYYIEGPACISFSGGRTSAFMLHRILDAHGGGLPSDVVVCFANTGLEHPKTLSFVGECSRRWAVPVVWLEYRRSENDHAFAVVTPATASTDGTPFSDLIATRPHLPNPVARYCTAELKVRCIRRYLVDVLGWDDWDNVLGLRADEPHRVAKTKASGERGGYICPMHDAGHTLADVEAFWARQPFDLGIEPHLGNCIGCFLKSRHKLDRIARESPDALAWWADAEGRFVSGDGTPSAFRADRPGYRLILKQVREQPVMFPVESDVDTLPCMCTE